MPVDKQLENNYLELHKASGIKVGDLVEIVDYASSYEHGWNNVWIEDMDYFVGSVQEVTGDMGSAGFMLDITGTAAYPYFVLEKVTEEIPSVPEEEPEPFEVP